MIQISVNTDTGTARPSVSPIIKAGGLVPVVLTFTSDPGTTPLIELAFSAQSSSPAVAAYLETFERQNPTTFTGWLDANDSRLLALLEGKQAIPVDCEIAWTVDGERQICPNFPVTVQLPILTGPASSEGGPLYYTAAQVETLLDEVLAAATIEIGTVTTLDPGEPVTVENVGTPSRAILNIGIPAGVQGIQGETGPLNTFAHVALTGTAIDWTADSFYYKTISTNTTFTWSNLTNGMTIVVDLTTSSGAVPTWPSGIVWPNGITPTHPTNGNAIYTFLRINDVVKGAMQPF